MNQEKKTNPKRFPDLSVNKVVKMSVFAQFSTAALSIQAIISSICWRHFKTVDLK